MRVTKTIKGTKAPFKKQEARRLLTNLRLKTPLSKIPLLDHILF